MSSVGIRELKSSASEIMRRVEEERETVEITRRGKLIGKIIPAEGPRSEESILRFEKRLAELQRAIAVEMGDRPVDAVALVQEQRRNLTPDEWVPVDWHPEE
jgi:prevent-host-death family protein